MINLYPTQINFLYTNKVGNKSKNEGFFSSKEPNHLNDEISGLLKEYFFKPFREKEENYLKFSHDVDLEYNELFNSCNSFFKNEITASSLSHEIVQHLYNQSSHPHIKSGEVYVCHLENIVLDDNSYEGIGIFKSELKHDFLQFSKDENKLDIVLTQGVSLGKLDKGVIIVNTEEEEGYKILSVDTNKYDTKYWLDNFLSVIEFEDSSYYTKKYLKFCQDFAKDVVNPAEDKKEEVMFMNRTVNHFAKNDEFEETNFLNEVIDNPELIPEFKHYKTEKGAKYSIEDLSTFPINNTAVSDARKKIKSLISLDTNITIKLDFINPESVDTFLEKGWDEERQMYYYLCYFNKENK